MGSELTAPAAVGLAGKLDRVPELAGTPRTVTELPGGLTNHNYKVTTGAGDFVARVWSGGGDFLAINRDHEYHNSVAAAQAGVGAPVVAYHPGDNLLVLRFIEGIALEGTPGRIEMVLCPEGDARGSRAGNGEHQ